MNTNNEKLKNSIFAPYLGTVFTFKYSGFSFFVIAHMDFDISSKKWKKLWFSDEQETKIQGFNQSGLTISVGINFNPI